MSNAKQETIEDIVAQLRAAAYIQNADSTRDVLKFADRIEAAHQREARKVRKEKLKARRGANGHDSRKRCGRRR